MGFLGTVYREVISPTAMAAVVSLNLFYGANILGGLAAGRTPIEIENHIVYSMCNPGGFTRDVDTDGDGRMDTRVHFAPRCGIVTEDISEGDRR